MDGHAADDMGLSKADLTELVSSFNWIQVQYPLLCVLK